MVEGDEVEEVEAPRDGHAGAHGRHGAPRVGSRAHARARVRPLQSLRFEPSRRLAYLHLAKWPCALRHSLGLAGQGAKWPLALRQTFGFS